MKIIGYARVSTAGQALDNQLEKLRNAGCFQIHEEKISGAHRDRPELKKALNCLAEGDVLIVTRLDRLARSTRDLLNIVDAIEVKGGQLRSLSESWADTTTPTGKLILTVLGGLAEFERSLIAERTAEGRQRARKAGRKLGRPSKLTKHQQDLVSQWRSEGKSNAEISRVLGVSRSTISRVG